MASKEGHPKLVSMPNLSHSGEDQAFTLKFTLEQMEVLAGTSLEYIIELVDSG